MKGDAEKDQKAVLALQAQRHVLSLGHADGKTRKSKVFSLVQCPIPSRPQSSFVLHSLGLLHRYAVGGRGGGHLEELATLSESLQVPRRVKTDPRLTNAYVTGSSLTSQNPAS